MDKKQTNLLGLDSVELRKVIDKFSGKELKTIYMFFDCVEAELDIKQKEILKLSEQIKELI